MEKKVVPTLINFKEPEIGAILVNHLENKKKTRIALILMGLLFLGASSLFAAGTEKKECVFKKIASVEARGIVDIVTSPLEVVATGKREIKMHSRLWPVTYVPRLIGNLVVRIVSSVNDVFVLPWYVAWGDDTPITRGFDLPDYAWQRD